MGSFAYSDDEAWTRPAVPWADDRALRGVPVPRQGDGSSEGADVYHGMPISSSPEPYRPSMLARTDQENLMARSFTSQDLIQLPRLSAAEAAVLITELLTAAAAEQRSIKGKELPPAIERSRKRLTVAHASLDAAVQPQASPETDTQVKRKSDRVIDNAWSATFDWLSGWCKLPPEVNPHLSEATSLFALVFPEALGFTKLPYKVEWQESKSRLDAIDREGHDKTFKQLGGGVFLDHIREAHEAYGAALHITVPKPQEAPPPDVRAKLDAAQAALRDYATRVAAHADPDVPGSEALTESLLKPLTEWESSHKAAPEPAEAAPSAPLEPEASP
jgi:hypothetical protein